MMVGKNRREDISSFSLFYSCWSKSDFSDDALWRSSFLLLLSLSSTSVVAAAVVVVGGNLSLAASLFFASSNEVIAIQILFD
jgi:hypothetical protein